MEVSLLRSLLYISKQHALMWFSTFFKKAWELYFLILKFVNLTQH